MLTTTTTMFLRTASLLFVGFLLIDNAVEAEDPTYVFARDCRSSLEFPTRFDVKVKTDADDNYRARCPYAYPVCPFKFDDKKRLGAKNWQLKSGKEFQLLETRTIVVPSGETPTIVYVALGNERNKRRQRHLDAIDNNNDIYNNEDNSSGLRRRDELELHNSLERKIVESNRVLQRSTSAYNCARALYKNKEQDFVLGSGINDENNNKKRLDVKSWWNNRSDKDQDPLHVTIIPFKGKIKDNGSCEPINNSKNSFDPTKTLAVWLTPSASDAVEFRQDGDEFLCDLGRNGKCLTEPYWEEGNNDDIYLYGSLEKYKNVNGKNLHIHIPEGTEFRYPINSLRIRFKHDGGDENKRRCQDFVDNPNSGSNCEVTSATVENIPLNFRVKVTGLGRINGFKALENQYKKNYGNFEAFEKKFKNQDTYIGNNMDYAKYIINANLLTLSSQSSAGRYTDDNKCRNKGINAYSVAINGPEVAWGSKIGQSVISLNSNYIRNKKNGDGNLAEFCTSLADTKLVGNWIEDAPGPDLMGRGSTSKFTYLHTNDDGIRVAVADSERKDTTILQGGDGLGLNIGSSGFTRERGVRDSVVDGMYVHRITQGTLGCDNNYAPGGAIVGTRSCGQTLPGKGTPGLQDFTLKNMNVVALGTNTQGANSIGVPFAIGVLERDNSRGICTSDNFEKADDYPIKNLKFFNSKIELVTACQSILYNDIGNIEFSSSNDKSLKFYESTNGGCGFGVVNGAVELGSGTNSRAYMCGFTNDDTARRRCISSKESKPNIRYSGPNNEQYENHVVFPRQSDNCTPSGNRRRLLRAVGGEGEGTITTATANTDAATNDTINNK